MAFERRFATRLASRNLTAIQPLMHLSHHSRRSRTSLPSSHNGLSSLVILIVVPPRELHGQMQQRLQQLLPAPTLISPVLLRTARIFITQSPRRHSPDNSYLRKWAPNPKSGSESCSSRQILQYFNDIRENIKYYDRPRVLVRKPSGKVAVARLCSHKKSARSCSACVKDDYELVGMGQRRDDHCLG
ncbi:hypothetical protein BJ170DRAFT_314870 [Xylariales sp. AK1849]|nr:hypothetical protein BJ170DRAFT_314870 [Xylariales sp. AK1849]